MTAGLAPPAAGDSSIRKPPTCETTLLPRLLDEDGYLPVCNLAMTLLVQTRDRLEPRPIDGGADTAVSASDR